ncbi:toxin-antitoxin system HicB family antitoxin [Entomobacter blattae]|uniref:Arc-like DNA binding domain-containing protein n=1 Tax=Entomobacter blattae TaxID=2762277 RepID=A0A7H1NP77_9PROT|nr:toxin-antitoxin system HicB family antitoxin [Entomobacter blattae]QNT77587.1 hypothetical protein JGUZn3_03300 [Entomobacter blattae]
MSRNPQFLLRLNEDLKKQLHQQAVGRGISLNAHITEILKEYLEKEKKQKLIAREQKSGFSRERNEEDSENGIADYLSLGQDVVKILEELQELHRLPNIEAAIARALESFATLTHWEKSKLPEIKDILQELQLEMKSGRTLLDLIPFLQAKSFVKGVSYNGRSREITFNMQDDYVFGIINEKGEARIIKM